MTNDSDDIIADVDFIYNIKTFNRPSFGDTTSLVKTDLKIYTLDAKNLSPDFNNLYIPINVNWDGNKQ